MPKIFHLAFALLFLCFSLAAQADGPDKQSANEIFTAKARIAHDFARAIDIRTLSASQKAAYLSAMAYVDPGHEVPQDLLQSALLYLQANKASFPNTDYVTVVD